MPTRAQRPRLPETSEGQRKAAQTWNEGQLNGTPRKSADTPVVAVCMVDACGSPVTGPARPTGMVEVRGSEEGAAAHWYCDGRCAAIASARAEIRAIPMRPRTDPVPVPRRGRTHRYDTQTGR